MRTTSIEEARKNLSEAMARVNADHEPLLIAGEAGAPAAVLVSAEDYASFEETAYLLRSLRNAGLLREATYDLDAGVGVERQLLE